MRFVQFLFFRHALARDFSLEPIIYDIWWRFSPLIVKVGALSAPTQEMLLKYCLDLSYIQNGSYLFLLFVKT